MEKAGPFDCCSHQAVASSSLLVSGLTVTVDILSIFFLCFRGSGVKSMLRIFWIWGFNVWLFCLLPKCNLSETFTR